MSSEKIIDHPDYGIIKFQKKSGLKRISMRLNSSGEIKVSLPYFVPWSVAENFVNNQSEWLSNQVASHKQYLPVNNSKIGKNHTLILKKGDKLKTYVKAGVITITYSTNINDTSVIIASKKAIKRALSQEAKEILPDRLEQLAKMYSYTYKSVKVKPMKTRWGSCDTHKNIALNCYLMELPWPLIDYVIMHELAHTKHLNHSQSFWQEVHSHTPNYKESKKHLKEKHKEVGLLYV